MTVEQLRLMHHAAPFRPFRICLADGRQIDVPHRDFMSYSPSGRTVIVHHPDDTYSVIDILLETELKVLPGAAAETTAVPARGNT